MSQKQVVNVGDLSPAERLFIQRRRQGWTVERAAKAHKVSVYQYRNWEQGRDDGVPTAALTSLKPQEKCVIMRRRSGKSTAQVAKELGCCRLWLRMMEDGRAEVARLQEFWRVR